MSIKKIKIMYGSCSQRVYGYIYEQDDSSLMSDKAVILCHGFNISHHYLEDIAYALAENGITALGFDFRGGSESSMSMGSPLDMSVRSEVDDALGAIEFIRRTRADRCKKLYLYGESQGGLVASLTGVSAYDKVDGLFLLYPAFCIPDDMKTVTPDDEGKIHILNMTISTKFLEGLPQFDVYEMMKAFPHFIRIHHGDADPIVRLSYSKRLYDELKALGRDVELFVYPGETHGFKAEAREKLRNDILETLKGVD